MAKEISSSSIVRQQSDPSSGSAVHNHMQIDDSASPRFSTFSSLTANLRGPSHMTTTFSTSDFASRRTNAHAARCILVQLPERHSTMADTNTVLRPRISKSCDLCKARKVRCIRRYFRLQGLSLPLCCDSKQNVNVDGLSRRPRLTELYQLSRKSSDPCEHIYLD